VLCMSKAQVNKSKTRVIVENIITRELLAVRNGFLLFKFKNP